MTLKTIYLFVLLNITFLICYIHCHQDSYTYCQAGMPSAAHTNPETAKFAANASLKQVIATIRHGDRTPVFPRPPRFTDSVEWDCSLNSLTIFSNSTDNFYQASSSSPLFRKVYLHNREVLPGNCMFGQLTEKGSQQHLRLGSLLRERYVNTYHLLPSELNLDDIWFRSTDVYRTIQSGQSLFYGLYPPSSIKSHLGAASSTPVVLLRTIDDSQDNMTPNTELCPRLNEVYEKLSETQAYQKFLKSLQPLQMAMNQLFQVPVQLDSLDDMSRARLCHGFPTPMNINESVVQQLNDASMYEVTFFMNDTETLRLGIGSLVGEQLGKMDAFIAGKEKQPFVLYSGHDTTILPLKRAYGYNEMLWPPYASNMLVELWQQQDNSTYYVMVTVNGEERMVPGCNALICPYDQFKSALQPLVPTDYFTECNLINPDISTTLKTERAHRIKPRLFYSRHLKF